MRISLNEAKNCLEEMEKYLGSPLSDALDKCRTNRNDEDTVRMIQVIKPHMSKTLHEFMEWAVNDVHFDMSDLNNMVFDRYNPFQALVDIYGYLATRE